ncbi:MAG TPA: hypothetical protein VK939_07910 [Longimicrobiales bacterium]|nr:hypothetical protein [Longimicrobiales bacterium]
MRYEGPRISADRYHATHIAASPPTLSDLPAALADRQNGDGGWGSRQGAASNAECTALTCLALETGARTVAPLSRSWRAGTAWLRARQQRGGAWHYDESGAAAPWPTPLALLALLREPESRAAVGRGYRWLIATRGAGLGWRLRLRQFLSRRQDVELDATLDGWPWVPGTFPWVEPTAWAMVALKARWPERPPRSVRARLADGKQLLADRACRGGGWNYGNTRVLDSHLAPFPDTTAIALLALRGRRDGVVDDGFRALDGLLDDNASMLSLALALLSARAWRRNADTLRARLVGRLEGEGPPADQRSSALATLALNAGTLPWLGEGADG